MRLLSAIRFLDLRRWQRSLLCDRLADLLVTSFGVLVALPIRVLGNMLSEQLKLLEEALRRAPQRAFEEAGERG